jgi:hypothetical protein
MKSARAYIVEVLHCMCYLRLVVGIANGIEMVRESTFVIQIAEGIALQLLFNRQPQRNRSSSIVSAHSIARFLLCKKPVDQAKR